MNIHNGIKQSRKSKTRFDLKWAILCLSLVLTMACQSKKQATEEECLKIFNQLIYLELKEMGFQDAVLTERWQKTLKKKYQSQITECVDRPLSPQAMTCIYEAKTAEEVSHDCL